MNQENLKVAVIQKSLVWNNIDQNLNQFENEFNSIESDTDLVILPETFTTGFINKTDELTVEKSQTILNWLISMSEKHNFHIMGSTFYKENSKIYNRLLAVYPNRTYQIYNKGHLFFEELDIKDMTKGEEVITITIKNWKIRPLICFDLRFPVWSRNTDGYDLLIYVANWPAVRKDAWNLLLPARAIENQSYCIGCNITGEDGDGYIYEGESQIIDPLGEILWKAGTNSNTIGYFSLDYQKLQEIRNHFPVLKFQDRFSIKKGDQN